MELKGVLIHIGEYQKVKDFVKREFVIETQEQYPQKIVLELHQDRVALIDPYKLGDIVNVSLNIRGKAYQDKNGQTRYFNTLLAWKIQK